MIAELSARRASARAALADYHRESDELDMTGRALWAERLASLLGLVLDELDRTGTEGGTE
jgi:FtsZ-binding cell division protein ZapB